MSGRYIEDEDDYYYEAGEDYEYYEDEGGYDYVEVDDDGNEYTESQTYGGGGCALALIALAGGSAAVTTAVWSLLPWA